jgi:hypothetical protein
VEFRAEVCYLLRARLLVSASAMLAMFLADPDLVYWELKSLGPNHIGPYRLVIQHASGIVNEYFDNLTRALRRMGELEDLLREAHAADEFDDMVEPGPDMSLQ